MKSLGIAEQEFLDQVVPYFGQPAGRRILSKDSIAVVVYRFQREDLTRYVTFGLHHLDNKIGKPIGFELLFVVKTPCPSAAPDTCYEFLFNLIAYLLTEEFELELPSLTPPSAIPTWGMKAMLFDEARGEDDRLSRLTVNGRDLELAWVVPLHADEWQFATDFGLEALDSRLLAASVELIDIERPSVIAAL